MNTAKNQRKNPLEVAFRKGEQEANTNKYEAELAQKSYYESARLEFIVSGVASYAANFVSILTAVTFVLFGMVAILPDFLPDVLSLTLSGSIALFALIMLEVVKRSNTTSFFRKRYTVRKASLKNTVALFALSLFSVILSVLGAADLARIATDKSELLQDTRSEQIADIYAERDVKILALEGETRKLKARMEKQIDDGFYATYTESVSATIEGNRQEQERIREDADKKVKEVERSFEGDSLTNEDKSKKALYFMLGLSTIAEILAILCLWFRVYYKYKVVSQRTHVSNEADESSKKKVMRVERVKPVSKPETREESPFTDALKPIHAAQESDDRIMGVSKNDYKHTQPCLNCGHDFTPRAIHQQFCITACRHEYHNKKRKSKKVKS